MLDINRHHQTSLYTHTSDRSYFLALLPRVEREASVPFFPEEFGEVLNEALLPIEYTLDQHVGELMLCCTLND